MATSQTTGWLASVLLPPAPGTAGRTPFGGLREPRHRVQNRRPQQAWLVVPEHP